MASRSVWARGVQPVAIAGRTEPASAERTEPASAARSVAETPVAYESMRPDRLVSPPIPTERPRGAPPGGPVSRNDPTLPIAGLGATREDHPFSSMRYVGQVRGVYLVLEDDRDLVLIDQHAAHERITYERLRGQLDRGSLESQRLLAPHHVDLGPAEADRIAALEAPLKRLGLDVSRSGPDRIAVRAVPAAAGHASADRLLAELVLALEAGRDGSGGASDDKALATLACHGSIRAGRPLSDEEARALLRQMDGVDFAGHCPHGRPVIARIPWTEIDKRVGRG
jgi:DNA mismatch repair protein MutL